jgi:hypothetical protein
LEEGLGEAFMTTQDGKSGFRALKDLNEFRTVSKEK